MFYSFKGVAVYCNWVNYFKTQLIISISVKTVISISLYISSSLHIYKNTNKTIKSISFFWWIFRCLLQKLHSSICQYIIIFVLMFFVVLAWVAWFLMENFQAFLPLLRSFLTFFSFSLLLISLFLVFLCLSL